MNPTTNPSFPNLTRRGFFGGTAALGFGALTGCSSSPEASKPNNKLVVWHNYTQGPRVKFMEAAGKAFEASHPGVTVSIEVVPAAQFGTKWPAAQSAGALPDVATASTDATLNMDLAQALHPMDDVLAALGGESAFVKGLVGKLGVWNDKVVSLPHYVHNRLLVHRTDYLSAAGITLPEAPTWDQALAAAVATQDAPKRFGWVLRLSQSDSGGAFLLWMLTRSTGGKFFDADGKMMLDTPEVTRAMEYLIEVAKTASTPAHSNYAISDTFSLMESGATALSEDSAALIGNTVQKVPAMANSLGSTFMPSDGAPGHLIGSYGFILPKGRNAELAREFVQFMYSDEMYVPFLQTIPLFMFPALAKVDTEKFYSEPTLAKFKPTVEQTLTGIAEGAAPGFEDGPNLYAGTVFGSHVVEEAIAGILLNGQDVKSALAAANKKTQTLVDDVKSRIR